MHKITFIGTIHDECGICTDEALLQILQNIEPEVIFEEIRPSDFDYFYELNSTLETKAVTAYCRSKKPIQVPVDRHEIPREHISEFKESLGKIFDYVEDKARECWMIKDEIDRNSGQYGFKYLNSVDYSTKWGRICDIQDKVIFGTGNQNWIRLLQIYRRQQKQRDIEMVKNIFEYCDTHLFDKGVFLVGATHKTGIINEIKRSNASGRSIKWIFAYDDQAY